MYSQAPVWQWAVTAGGTSNNYGRMIAKDNQGNIYVAGVFADTANFGLTSITSSGYYDIFIAKLDSNGNWLWAKKGGGSDDDHIFGIATDNMANIYITGCFAGNGTYGSTILSNSNGYGMFAAKLDSNGNWIWAKTTGGTGTDKGIGIAVDNSFNVYLTGHFNGTVNFGTTILSSEANTAIYIAKADSNGIWQWAKQAVVSDSDYGMAIATDYEGNSYVTGTFAGTTVFGVTSLTSIGYEDIFIAKLDYGGNWLWIKQAGSISNDYDSDHVNGICVGCDASVYLTGYFNGTAMFGNSFLTSYGYEDIFVSKLDCNGNWLWAEHAGSSYFDYGYGIVVDNSTNVYLSGGFSGTCFFGSNSLTSIGGLDIFVTKLDSDGNWIWVKKAGGTLEDRGYCITLDCSNNVFVTGHYRGTAFFGDAFLVSGINNIFVAKIGFTTLVSDEPNNSIFPYSLAQNYPNPFYNVTKLSYEVKDRFPIRIDVFNSKGQFITTLVNEIKESGCYNVTWNGTDNLGNSVASGIYYYRMHAGKYQTSRRMLLLN